MVKIRKIAKHSQVDGMLIFLPAKISGSLLLYNLPDLEHQMVSQLTI